jgi:hypothetical protein
MYSVVCTRSTCRGDGTKHNTSLYFVSLVTCGRVVPVTCVGSCLVLDVRRGQVLTHKLKRPKMLHLAMDLQIRT